MTSSFDQLVCENCGENAMSLILTAMMEDAGARCYPSSSHCTEEMKHKFVPKVEAPHP